MPAVWKMLLLVALFGFIVCVVEGCVNNGPLGMVSGEIEDWQLTASSSYPAEWDAGCAVKYARPYIQEKRAWCARFKTSSEWLQIDMGVAAMVTGVMTQGRGDNKEWVTQYLISYSPDGQLWSYVMDSLNTPRIFDGNTDSYSTQHNYLPQPVYARYIKIQVYAWNNHPSMRVELIGCQDKKQQLGLQPYGVFRASSAHRYRGGSSCQPSDGHLLSGKAWCPSESAEGEWLELDVGPPSLVTAVITKGRGDTGRRQWVTRYRLAFSNDSTNWTFYQDSQNSQQPAESQDAGGLYSGLGNRVSADGVMEFGGNADKDTARVHYLSQPFTARYIRFYPTEWRRSVALRVAVLGKPFQGECGAGFTRPNPLSPCVENIAYKKETWLNKDRHQKRALEGVAAPTLSEQLSQKAVDGLTVNDINYCTIVDNYYDDEPQLTIDLGRKYSVAGVLVYTWLGQLDKSNIYNKDYSVSIESLSVYVSSGKGDEELCGKISNENNELILTREQSLTCSHRITGQYIRIQPDGRAERWNKWYSAVICEVMAFT